MHQTKTSGNEQQAHEGPPRERLEAMLTAYERYGRFSTSRKERIVDLMKRHSARKWTAQKKARMTRRLLEADNGIDQSASFVSQLRDRLEQLDKGG